MAVTIYDIAEVLETSRSTVSRALRNDSKIALATRKRVKKQALEMGYRPNLLARALVNGKTQTIGFLTGSVILEVTSATMAKLGDIAREGGYGVHMADTKGELDLTVKQAHELIARGVDGLIIRGCFPEATVEQLQTELDFSVPTVFIGGVRMPLPCQQVYYDQAIGVKQAVDSLYELGHRQIHMFFMPWKGWEKETRFSGFYEAMAERGLDGGREGLYEFPPGHLDEDGHRFFDIDVCFSRTKKFLKSHPDCTAILCSDDKLALLVLSHLVHMGVRVPEDISVVGFDGMAATAYSLPPLSTVVLPIGEMVHTAFDLLMDSMKNNNNQPKEVVIPSKFLVRRSAEQVRIRKEVTPG
ncbi:MAG: LacI family transcriptional regulator [Anaerohalosphaeraceae bacterium]|nr:LacI family transcriptional regulator [Anaerohalosphaeraceae bacterium]